MVSIWSQHGRNMVSAWSQHGPNIVSAWSRHGINMVSAWFQHGLNMVSTWSQHGLDMVSAWSQHGHNMVSTWSQHALSMVSTWSQHGHIMVSAWSQHGLKRQARTRQVRVLGHSMHWRKTKTRFLNLKQNRLRAILKRNSIFFVSLISSAFGQNTLSGWHFLCREKNNPLTTNVLMCERALTLTHSRLETKPGVLDHPQCGSRHVDQKWWWWVDA